MNLYKISQDINGRCLTFDSAVVVANTSDEARDTHPCGKLLVECDTLRDWATRENVVVELIGKALPEQKKGVICASFNAG